MLVRKARGGGGAAGYYWENHGDVLDVPDDLGQELLAMPGLDYSYVDPEEVEPADETEGEEPAEKPKRQYKRRTTQAAETTEVAE
jgi:hypothetical protein